MTFLAAIVISLPVCGFRPLRSARCVTEKEPNPTRDTRSPLLKAPAVASIKESSARLASAFEMPAPAAIASTNSALFMVYGFRFELLRQIYRSESKYIRGYSIFRE